MQTFVQSRMGATNVASHTLSPFSKKCKLKRGPKNCYVFDTMNLLYSMCGISAIADLLMQKPPVPTCETVRFTLSLSVLFCAWFKLIFAFICLQTFAYLDRWCKTHNFDGTNTKKGEKQPVHIIFVVDGRIDQFKIARYVFACLLYFCLNCFIFACIFILLFSCLRLLVCTLLAGIYRIINDK